MGKYPPDSPKMRILLVGSQIEVAGAQRVLLEQARWFQKRGHEVTAVFLYDKAGLGEVWKKRYTFQIIVLDARRLKSSGLMNGLRFFKALYRFLLLLKKHDFDVIETFTIHSNLFAIPLAYLLAVPVRIPTHHGYVGGVSALLQKLHGFMINSKMVSQLVAVSDKAGEVAIKDEGVRNEKIAIILNGIRIPEEVEEREVKLIRKEVGVLKNDAMILAVGRLVEQKGFHLLIQTADKVVREYPGTKFLIAGEGRLKASLEAMVTNLNLQDNINFVGIREDIPELLMSADIYLTTSLWEGLSLALLEAMAAGLPVVTTAVEGVGNVVAHEKNGLIVPVGDVDAIADAVNRLIGASSLRHSLGSAAKETILRSHSLGKMCREYERLFLDFYGP